MGRNMSWKVALLGLCGQAAALTLFNGQQVQLFRNTEISRNCAVALNTELRCPGIVQSLTFPDYALNLTLPKLNALCASSCLTDIGDFAERVAARCGNDLVHLQIGEISFADLGEFIKHRSELLCLRESSGGRFCHEVMPSWDIPTLESEGQLTWPEHTSKCIVHQETGNCLTWAEILEAAGHYETDTDDIPEWMFPAGEFNGEDYFRDRSGVLEGAKRHSLGASERLGWDEYPIEIQCNRCFWKTFAIGQESQWAHLLWDKWTQQIWDNMVMNCDIRGEDAVITPYSNLTDVPPTDPDAPTQREPDWELCPSTARVADDNEGTIWDFAEKASLPMACLRSFNPGLPYDAISLRNQRLCVPLTCETVVVDEIMSIQDFVQNELEDVALFQFLEWNKCLHQSSIILKRDRVCVGPHRGKYTPTLVDIATSTIFTTTATPNPTARPPPLTIRNCGLFHIITEKDTCAQLSLRYRVTVHKLRNMNPTIDSECSNLTVGRSYCVAPVNGTEVPDVTTTYAPTQLSTTSRSSSSSSPQRRTAPSVSTTVSAE